MSDLTVTTTVPQRNTNPTVGVNNPVTGKRTKIGGRLKAALDLMVWNGKPWNGAAQEAGFQVGSMRKALERPHIRAYLNEQRQVFRASISAQNFHRLREIRDQDDNRMAALGAIKLLEEQPEDAARNAAAKTPGVAIFIGVTDGSSARIEAKPLTINASVSGEDVE